MKVLLTGFGAFTAKDGARIEDNITQLIVQEVYSGWKRLDCQIWVSVLPVEWRAAENILVKTLEIFSFDLAIFMGHARGYKKLALEATYFNKAGRADMSGAIPPGGVIKADGAEFYNSNIVCLPQLAGWLNARGIPAEIHAGPEGMDYLCNLPGFLTGHYLAKKNLSKPRFLVVHIPDPVDLSYKISLEGVRCIIHFLTNSL
jgi:pyrrolidone-carboxylate peptidase